MITKELSADSLSERWDLGVRRIDQIRIEPGIKGVLKYKKGHFIKAPNRQ
jgi:hypothetical protein